MAGKEEIHQPYKFKRFFLGIDTKKGTTWNTMPRGLKPHWSEWRVEGTSFEIAQKKLAKKGLKDPWARNDVWRYHSHKNYPGFSKLFFSGIRPGFAVFVFAYIADQLYGDFSNRRYK